MIEVYAKSTSHGNNWDCMVETNTEIDFDSAIFIVKLKLATSHVINYT